MSHKLKAFFLEHASTALQKSNVEIMAHCLSGDYTVEEQILVYVNCQSTLNVTISIGPYGIAISDGTQKQLDPTDTTTLIGKLHELVPFDEKEVLNDIFDAQVNSIPLKLCFYRFCCGLVCDVESTFRRVAVASDDSLLCSIAEDEESSGTAAMEITPRDELRRCVNEAIGYIMECRDYNYEFNRRYNSQHNEWQEVHRLFVPLFDRLVVHLESLAIIDDPWECRRQKTPSPPDSRAAYL